MGIVPIGLGTLTAIAGTTFGSCASIAVQFWSANTGGCAPGTAGSPSCGSTKSATPLRLLSNAAVQTERYAELPGSEGTRNEPGLPAWLKSSVGLDSRRS